MQIAPFFALKTSQTPDDMSDVAVSVQGVVAAETADTFALIFDGLPLRDANKDIVGDAANSDALTPQQVLTVFENLPSVGLPLSGVLSAAPQPAPVVTSQDISRATPQITSLTAPALSSALTPLVTSDATAEPALDPKAPVLPAGVAQPVLKTAEALVSNFKPPAAISADSPAIALPNAPASASDQPQTTALNATPQSPAASALSVDNTTPPTPVVPSKSQAQPTDQPATVLPRTNTPQIAAATLAPPQADPRAPHPMPSGATQLQPPQPVSPTTSNLPPQADGGLPTPAKRTDGPAPSSLATAAPDPAATTFSPPFNPAAQRTTMPDQTPTNPRRDLADAADPRNGSIATQAPSRDLAPKPVSFVPSVADANFSATSVVADATAPVTETDPAQAAIERTHSAPLTTTAQAAPTAPPRQIAQQIAQAFNINATGATELTLNPEELGRVKITFSGNDAGMIVTLQSDRPDTQDMLRRNVDLLLREFENAGFETLDFAFSGDGSKTPPDADTSPDTDDPAPDFTHPSNAQITHLSPTSTGIDIRL